MATEGRSTAPKQDGPTPHGSSAPVVIVSLALVAFLWGEVITQTAEGVKATVEEALPQVFGASGGSYSADTSYSLLLGRGPSSP